MSRSYASLDGDEPSASGAVDADAAVLAERLRERAVDVASEERRAAEAKLESQGGLTEAQRETLADLAEAIAAGVVGPPVDALAADEADDETRRTVADLFGVDTGPAGHDARRPSAADD